jgi:hypothetical protein
MLFKVSRKCILLRRPIISKRFEGARKLPALPLYCCWEGLACSVDDGEVEAMVKAIGPDRQMGYGHDQEDL